MEPGDDRIEAHEEWLCLRLPGWRRFTRSVTRAAWRRKLWANLGGFLRIVKNRGMEDPSGPGVLGVRPTWEMLVRHAMRMARLRRLWGVLGGHLKYMFRAGRAQEATFQLE